MSVVAIDQRQFVLDKFYTEHGPCCAGCDWWHHINSVIGECRRAAPVPAEQRYSMARLNWNTFPNQQADAGHILTNREHHCGDFKDDFDWSSLSPSYLRRIGRAAASIGPTP